MGRTTTRAAAITAATIVLAACGGAEDPAPSVTFVQPEDEATVESPAVVEMAAEGVTVEPAADGVNEGAGHFHVIVDEGCVEPGEVIPSDESHVHFGDGSTTGEIELEPGEHTLCLQFATGDHVASGLTDTVTVTVIE